LQVSATPDNTIYNIDEESSEMWEKVHLEVPDTYIGPWDLLRNNRIQEAPKIQAIVDARSLINRMRIEFDTPKYHILRLEKSSQEDLMRKAAEEMHLDCEIHDQTDHKSLAFFSVAPPRHTLVFIKEMWRASIRVCDRHLGILLETSKSDTACVQGFVGRICGHDKQMPLPRGTPLVLMANPESVEKYSKLWASGMNYEETNHYTGNNIRVKNGVVKANKSMNSSMFVTSNAPGNVVPSESHIETMVFLPHQREDARRYCLSGNRWKRGPAVLQEMHRTDKWHECTIRSKKMKRTVDEVVGQKWGTSSAARAYLCYADKNDMSTLRLVIASQNVLRFAQ
jgi:hypothetical protein